MKIIQLITMLLIVYLSGNVVAEVQSPIKQKDIVHFQTESGIDVDYRKINAPNTMINIRVYGNHLITNAQSGDIPHFVEHMIFKGSLANPSRLSFIEFLNQHAYGNKGSTGFFHTDFNFEVNKENLSNTIKRIVEQIKTPLFSKDQIQQELPSYLDEKGLPVKNASKSEVEKIQTCFRPDLDNISRIDMQKISEIDIEKLHQEVIEFYRNTYQAKNIEIVVASSQPVELFKELLAPLDQLISLVEKPNSNFILQTNKIRICEPEADQSWVVIPIDHSYATLNTENFLQWIIQAQEKTSLPNQLKQDAYVEYIGFESLKVNKNKRFLLIQLRYQKGMKTQENQEKTLKHIHQFAEQMSYQVSEKAVQVWNLSDELFVKQRHWGSSRFALLPSHLSIDPDVSVKWAKQIFAQIAGQLGTLSELKTATTKYKKIDYAVLGSMYRIPEKTKLLVQEKDRYPIHDVKKGYIFEPIIYSEVASYGKVFFKLRFQNTSAIEASQLSKQIVQQYQLSTLQSQLNSTYSSINLTAINGEILVEVADFSNQLGDLVNEILLFIKSASHQGIFHENKVITEKIHSQLTLVGDYPIVLLGELTHEQVMEIKDHLVQEFPISGISSVPNTNSNTSKFIASNCASSHTLIYKGKAAGVFSNVAGKMLYLLSIGSSFNMKMHFDKGYYWLNTDINQSHGDLLLSFSIKGKKERGNWREIMQESISSIASKESIMPMFEYHKKMVKTELEQRVGFFQDMNEYYTKEMMGERERKQFTSLKEEIELLDEITFSDFYIPINEILLKNGTHSTSCINGKIQ